MSFAVILLPQRRLIYLLSLALLCVSECRYIRQYPGTGPGNFNRGQAQRSILKGWGERVVVRKEYNIWEGTL